MFDFLKRFATPAQLREAGVLGMNRRNYEIIAKSNDRRLYPLVDDKVQTSLNLLKLVAKLNEAYDIKITAMHLMPENFNSAEAIYALIEKLS